MSTQQDIYAASSENRPLMLNKENYVPWSSRLLCYAKSKPNGKLIYNCPYVRRIIPEPGDPDHYTQLYDFLKYNPKKVDDLRAERLAKTHDPLALIEDSNNPYNYLVFYLDQPSPIRTEGKANKNNANQIRCYNCRGLGHLDRNCMVRPRRIDDAYLQTQLLIAQ
nr:ribonuclease H-like domain-containing protein [Tanacetum cinerariifolium]